MLFKIAVVIHCDFVIEVTLKFRFPHDLMQRNIVKPKYIQEPGEGVGEQRPFEICDSCSHKYELFTKAGGPLASVI